MRTSESIRNGSRCPVCHGEMTDDPQGKGFVRHRYPVYIRDAHGNRVQCEYGRGERDPDPGVMRRNSDGRSAAGGEMGMASVAVADQGVVIESASGEEITSVEDWFRLAPPEAGAVQWQDWRSAKELARAWFRSGSAQVPKEVRAALEDHIWTKGIAVTRIVPEMFLRFDGFAGNRRKSDLVMFGEADGKGVLVAVEAKADEQFGPLIFEYRQQNVGTDSRIPERIDLLVAAIFGRKSVDAEIGCLRYQLLHGLGGALAEAGRRGLSRTVFLIHEFRSIALDVTKVRRNADDLDRFVETVSAGRASIVPSGKLIGPFCVPGGGMIPRNSYFLVGKAVTHLMAPGVVRS